MQRREQNNKREITRKKSNIKPLELDFKNVLEESYGTLETWKLEEELGSTAMSYKSLVPWKFNW